MTGSDVQDNRVSDNEGELEHDNDPSLSTPATDYGAPAESVIATLNVVADMAPAAVVLAMASADGGEARPWLITDGHALPLADWASDWSLARVGTLTELVEHWPDHASGLRALTTQAETRDRIVSQGNNVASLCVHAPIEPRQAFCTIELGRALPPTAATSRKCPCSVCGSCRWLSCT